MVLKHQILAWFFLCVGLIEVTANVFFLVRLVCRKDFAPAQTFHGDFPPFASRRAWTIKVVAMLLIGMSALSASILIFLVNPTRTVSIWIVSDGMLGVGFVQAFRYGSKHPPAFGSLWVGLVFSVLTYFLD